MRSSLLMDWVRLSRLEHSVITFFAIVLAGAVSVGFGRFNLERAAFAALGPALITAASFILNDWAGYKSDKANKRKDRPLVAGLIKKEHALFASVALFLSGLLLVLLLGNNALFLIAAVYSLLAIAYDPVLKKLPLAGNLFIAASMAVPFIYGNLAAAPRLDLAVVVLASMAFLAGIGRELIITLRDTKGDRAIGANTLPMILGPHRTSLMAAYFLVSGVGISLIPIGMWFSLFYLVLVAVADALFIQTVVEVLHDQKPQTLKSARNRTLVAMMLGTAAFAGLAFW